MGKKVVDIDVFFKIIDESLAEALDCAVDSKTISFKNYGIVAASVAAIKEAAIGLAYELPEEKS
jgi:hypothetical protein